MTLDLDAIRARYEAAELEYTDEAFASSFRDIPALVAEVERLRAAVLGIASDIEAEEQAVDTNNGKAYCRMCGLDAKARRQHKKHCLVAQLRNIALKGTPCK